MNPEKLLNPDYQEKVLDLAETLVSAYPKLPVSTSACYFTEKADGYGDDYGSDEMCCNDDECVKLATKKMRVKYGNFKVFPNFYYHDNDTHIDTCSVCGCALDGYINNVSEELPHHMENTRSLADIIGHAQTVSELSAVFYRLRCDGFEEPKRYHGCTDQKFADQQQHYNEKWIEAMEYALHIINELFPITEDELDKLVDVRGLYTIYEEKVTADITKARFIDTKVTPAVWKECWMYDDFHGATLAQAKAERKRRLNEKKQQEQAVENYKKARLRYYSYRDFRRAGNCRDGILGFVQRAGLNVKEKYQGTYLLEVAEKHGRKWDIENTIKKLAQV